MPDYLTIVFTDYSKFQSASNFQCLVKNFKDSYPIP